MYLLPSLNTDRFCEFYVFYLPPCFPPEYLKIKSQASSHFTHISGLRFTWASFLFCYYCQNSVVSCLHSIPFSSSVQSSSFSFGNCLPQFGGDAHPLASWTPWEHDPDGSVWVFLWGVPWKLRMKVSLYESMGLKNPISLDLQKVIFSKWESPPTNHANTKESQTKRF